MTVFYNLLDSRHDRNYREPISNISVHVLWELALDSNTSFRIKTVCAFLQGRYLYLAVYRDIFPLYN